MKKVILEVVKELNERGSGGVDFGSMVQEAARRLNIIKNLEEEQALLTYFYDLFRLGHLSWGYNLCNINPPFCHLTDIGRKTLEQLNRDPANTDGYLTNLKSLVTINSLAQNYIEEGLGCFNSGYYKASAVMIGAAAESIVHELRDAMVIKRVSLNKSIHQDLKSHLINRVLDRLRRLLDQKKSDMLQRLQEAYSAFWSAFVQQIRIARNDAGHPSSLSSVNFETVHASLLIFPELAKLAYDLIDWVDKHYTI